MSLHRLTSSIRRLFNRRAKAAARRQTSARLQLQALEDRSVPASITNGNITGQAFIDANNNRVRDPNEIPLAGAPILLVGNTDYGRPVRVLLSTGAAGGYRFNNVTEGSYQVVANPAGTFMPFGANRPVIIFQGRLNGGQTIGRNVSYRSSTPSTVSLTQFSNTATSQSFQNLPSGSGTANVNPRKNHRPTVSGLDTVNISKNNPPKVVNLDAGFLDPDMNSQVQLQTLLGNITIDLYDNLAPGTVANFIRYIEANRYDNAIFSRLGAFLHGTSTVRDVLQGGQFTFSSTNGTGNLTQIQTFESIQDEVDLPNVAGTISMAKTSSRNSATSQFFFNLIDNTDALSPANQTNGGFTVFGKVDAASMQVVNALAAFNVQDKSSFNSALSTLPLKNTASAAFPGSTVESDYALIKDVKVINKVVGRVESFTYKVLGNTNPSLVRVTLNGNQLTVKAQPNSTGSSRVTIRATDRQGVFVDTSFNVVVANDAPVVGVLLDPSSPTTNQTMTATVERVGDQNGDVVNFTYVWKKNGVEIKRTSNTSARTDTLDLSQPGNGDRGDVITVDVTPADSQASGATVTLARTVADSAPAVSQLAFNPEAPGTDDALTVTTTAADPDGDALTFNYKWTVDNVVVRTENGTASTTDAIDLSTAGFGNPGQTVKVEVTPIANGLSGTPVSRSVVVA